MSVGNWGSVVFSFRPLTVTRRFMVTLQTNWDQVCESFDDMKLREELQRGIYAYG